MGTPGVRPEYRVTPSHRFVPPGVGIAVPPSVTSFKCVPPPGLTGIRILFPREVSQLTRDEGRRPWPRPRRSPLPPVAGRGVESPTSLGLPRRQPVPSVSLQPVTGLGLGDPTRLVTPPIRTSTTQRDPLRPGWTPRPPLPSLHRYRCESYSLLRGLGSTQETGVFGGEGTRTSGWFPRRLSSNITNGTTTTSKTTTVLEGSRDRHRGMVPGWVVESGVVPGTGPRSLSAPGVTVRSVGSGQNQGEPPVTESRVGTGDPP